MQHLLRHGSLWLFPQLTDGVFLLAGWLNRLRALHVVSVWYWLVLVHLYPDHPLRSDFLILPIASTWWLAHAWHFFNHYIECLVSHEMIVVEGVTRSPPWKHRLRHISWDFFGRSLVALLVLTCHTFCKISCLIILLDRLLWKPKDSLWEARLLLHVCL